jgi:hypothetical protein
MLIGLTLAALAALGSGAGSAIEALGVRRAAHRTRRPGDVGALLREPVYFFGLTVNLLGFAFTVLALQVLPLYLVQAVVASSVAVTAVIFAVIGRPLDRAGWVALGGSLCGLVLLGLSSQPHDVPPLDPVWYWLLLATSVPIAGLGWAAIRGAGTWSSVLLALGAGLAFSCVAVAARSLDVPEPVVARRDRPGDLGDRGERGAGRRPVRAGPATGPGDRGRRRFLHHQHCGAVGGRPTVPR